MHTLKREQSVRADLEEVWRFLSTPANLDRITPADLCFQIVSEVPAEMHNGLIIEYRIRIPFFGRQRWLAEIKHIRPLCSFVDEQRLGPFRFWYHYHQVTGTGSGVCILDRVYYEVPYGPVGEILHRLVVRPTLERIFTFRRDRLAEHFG